MPFEARGYSNYESLMQCRAVAVREWVRCCTSLLEGLDEFICFVGCVVESGSSLISCPLWSCLVYLLVKFIKHNQNYYLKLDVSTSIRALHRKKLVLSSSGSWYDGKTPCQESGRMHGSALITVHGLLSFLSGCVWPLIHLMEASDRGRNVKF